MSHNVLIVDDSALVRQTLTRILGAHPDLEVMGAAHDPFHAAQLIRERRPDVIVLDIEMPRMDGITFLRRLMAQHPIPTVVCSSLAAEASPMAMAALEAGAVDVVQKPTLMTRDALTAEGTRITDIVLAASRANVRGWRPPARPSSRTPTVGDGQAVPSSLLRHVRTTDLVVAIGASTGGTEAIRVVLEGFGPDSPGVVIVQHMPPGFTATLARRLDQLCSVRVREATDGDPVLTGHVLIAPGDRHMVVHRSGARFVVQIVDAPPRNRHRPSVDVLFDSVALHAGRNAVGVILTGMGDDGARGLLRMREAGAQTIAQDEASSIVYGMPKEAMRLGGAMQQVDLADVAAVVHQVCAA